MNFHDQLIKYGYSASRTLVLSCVELSESLDALFRIDMMCAAETPIEIIHAA